MVIVYEQLYNAALFGKEDIEVRLAKALDERTRLEEDIKFFRQKIKDYDTVINTFKGVNDDKIRHDN